MIKKILFAVILISLSICAQENKTLHNPSHFFFETSDSVNLFIKIKGNGVPCLYLHGGPGSGSFWLEKFSGDMLEANYTMIYLDQRGVGRSTSPKDKNYSLDRMIDDFEEIRKNLGIEKWILLGHSFGGVLQTAYAEKYPDKIMGMVMINCTLNMNESMENSWLPNACRFLEIEDTKYFQNKSIPLLNRLDEAIKMLNEKGLMWKMGYADENNEKNMGATFGEIPNWNNDLANTILSYSDYWRDFSSITQNLEMPVLFFYGKTDWMVGSEHYKLIRFPEVILWRSNVGHMPFLENATDLEKAIKSFNSKYNF